MGRKSNDLRKGEDRDTHREEDYLEVEIGVMLQQAKECQESQETAREGRILPQSFQREHGPAETLTLDIWSPEQ